MGAFEELTPPSPDLPSILPQMSFQPTQDHLNYEPSTYYIHPPQSHTQSPVIRTENTPQRQKRPKYTRSKSGCMTCRVKKIKCDEAKPTCMRCTHGQRDCTWPDENKQRKKSAPRKSEQANAASYPASNSNSPAVSEGSSTRGHSPPRREPAQTNQTLRRRSEPYSHHEHETVEQEQDFTRRQSVPQGYHAHLSQPLSNGLERIPEIGSYPLLYTPAHEEHRLGESSRSSSRPESSDGRTMAPMPHYHSSGHSMTFGNGHPLGQQPGHHWTPPLLTHVDAIEPYFHNIQERNLIKHYCTASLHIIMAVPSENSVAGANLPLIMSRPPGDTTSEALRNSLLAVAAIHRSFLLARSGATPEGADEMLQLAHRYRMSSKTLLAQACTTPEGTYSDACLAACLAISLTDIFSGGRNWARNIDLAKTLVSVRGGPSALLANSTEATSRTRLLLEILAVYDIFGALATSNEPTVLNGGSNSWWDDEPHASSSSVETVFGMSRKFIPLLARVVAFVSKVMHGTARITEVIDGLESFETDETKECHELFNVLEEWTAGGNPLRRVEAGNTIYRKALQIMLLRDCLSVPLTDPLVQDCANTVLALCLSCAKSEMSVDLLWPVIIAGSQTYGTDRPCVLEILEEYRKQCCYEVDTASQIIFMVWKRMDQQQADPTLDTRADWRSVMRDFDLSILVL